MNILLVVILSLLLVFIYFVNGKRIVSISFISTGVFFLSAIVLLSFGGSFFEYSVSPITVFVVVTSNALLFVGEFFALKVLKLITTKSNKKHHEAIRTPFYVDQTTCILLFFIGFIIAIIDYYFLYRYSLSLGNPGQIWNAIAYTRDARVTSTDFSLPRILSYAGIVFKAFAYLFFFYFAYNLILCKKLQFKLLLPLVSYCLIYFSSTERLGYLEIVSVCIIIILVIKNYQNRWKKSSSIKSLVTILIVIASTITIFYLLGSFSGKSARHNLTETICKYLGASIVGLDNYLHSPWSPNTIPCEQTLYYFYYLLKAIGFNLPITKSFLPFFTWANGSSNIYTCLVAPIHDFGITGMLVSRLLLGFIYGCAEYKIDNLKSIKNHGILIVVFSLFFYPVAISSIADIFLFFVQLNYIYLFIVFVVYRHFTPKKRVFLVKTVA